MHFLNSSKNINSRKEGMISLVRYDIYYIKSIVTHVCAISTFPLLLFKSSNLLFVKRFQQSLMRKWHKKIIFVYTGPYLTNVSQLRILSASKCSITRSYGSLDVIIALCYSVHATRSKCYVL